jgi:serine/threonine protein kinase
MTPQRWQQLEALYDAAVELSPPERARFLDEKCRGDEDLRREVAAMFEDGSSRVTDLVARAAVAVVEDPGAWSGQRLGPYRLVRLIGQGGMGAVYEGVREDDFHKRVAIKLVKYGFDSEFARRRFQQERQILARLDHPNIARLLDGGDYQNGLPYLVMEFVEGEPLLTAASSLGIPAKLRLFQKILSTVAYAHGQLIVHRDLKPANILVSETGDPKLLDFGIARLIDEDSGGSGPRTMTIAPMMTPDYASPEQVKGEPAGVASDIYSLGATLFELLCGARPHQLETYSPAEMYRVICESELRAPSACAADRQIQRELRGDLDTLVLHAMAREPAGRYASAEAFSAEIERYLAGRPLTVRPASSIERGWKFVKRNRWAVAAAIALAASLIGGITVSTIEARRAERRFAQVRELANTFLFQFYDQVTPLPGSTAVRASIVETARKYLDGLANDAGNDKGLILELAQAYGRLGFVQRTSGMASLGQVEDARRSFQRALDLYARLPVNRGSPPDLRRQYATVLYALVSLEYNAGHQDVAEKLARQMLSLLDDRNPDPATRRLRALGERSLADVRLQEGHSAEAVALMESTLRTLVELRSSGHGDPNLQLAIDHTEQYLAHARVFTGDLDGALSGLLDLLRRSAPCDQRAPPGVECRELSYRLSSAADVYASPGVPNLDEPGKAAILYQQAIHISERLAALDEHDRGARLDLANGYGSLGDAVWKSDPKRALSLYERALATAQALASKEQLEAQRDTYLLSISRPLIQLGRTAEARKALTEFLQRAKTDAHSLYPDRLDEVEGRAVLPSLLLAEGKRAEAHQTLEDLIRDTEALRASHPEDLTPVYYVSEQYRALASMTTGQERREALLHSAAAWHSWPATSFTRREEQKDLAAANR